MPFRVFFLVALLLITSACAPTRDLTAAPKGTQRIVIWHKQSGEQIDVTTRSGGEYNRNAFDKIDYIFRDRHTDEVYPIDPKLIDVIAELRDKLLMSPEDPIELLSGYRSPESNANLAKVNRYVAKNSYHTKGQAADIRIPTMNSSAIEAVAKTMQRGGVALYPDSGHIHVDTGPVRGWAVIRGYEAGLRRGGDRAEARATHYHGRVPVMRDTQFVKPVVIKPPANSYDTLPQPKKPLASDGKGKHFLKTTHPPAKKPAGKTGAKAAHPAATHGGKAAPAKTGKKPVKKPAKKAAGDE